MLLLGIHRSFTGEMLRIQVRLPHYGLRATRRADLIL
jgi:hypothetical protein